METPRERAQSFLCRQLGWVRAFADGDLGEDREQHDGRVAGAVGALRAVGLLDGEEAEAWKRIFHEPSRDRPEAGPEVRQRADEVLAALLDAVPESADDDAGTDTLDRFEGALGALEWVGAAGVEWDQRLRQRLGRLSAKEELARMRELNAGGTEQELVRVIAGPAEAVDGVRVLYALLFGDGVSFEIHREQPVHELRGWDYELRDDLGTEYTPGGAGGGNGHQHVSFRTAVPDGVSWLELIPHDAGELRLLL